jgi:hypothetical protein
MENRTHNKNEILVTVMSGIIGIHGIRIVQLLVVAGLANSSKRATMSSCLFSFANHTAVLLL